MSNFPCSHSRFHSCCICVILDVQDVWKQTTVVKLFQFSCGRMFYHSSVFCISFAIHGEKDDHQNNQCKCSFQRNKKRKKSLDIIFIIYLVCADSYCHQLHCNSHTIIFFIFPLQFMVKKIIKKNVVNERFRKIKKA